MEPVLSSFSMIGNEKRAYRDLHVMHDAQGRGSSIHARRRRGARRISVRVNGCAGHFLKGASDGWLLVVPMEELMGDLPIAIPFEQGEYVGSSGIGAGQSA